MHHAHIDKFAYGDSPIHRLDSRVKFIAVIVFTVAVISLPITTFSLLFCYAIWPFALLVIAGIPLKFVLKQILLVSPFIAVLAFSFLLYERDHVTVAFGPLSWQMTLGWTKCFSVLAKFAVTMTALIALVSTTRFTDLLAGLERLGVPKLLILQTGFLYRYIFVLIDRAHHILRARAMRSMRKLGLKTEIKTASAMVGSLLITSIDSAERINIAMQARGFDGTFRTFNRLKIAAADFVFAAISACFLLGMQFIVKPFFEG